jgi:hypothetical protein
VLFYSLPQLFKLRMSKRVTLGVAAVKEGLHSSKIDVHKTGLLAAENAWICIYEK